MLVTGEAGVGKSRLIRYCHGLFARRARGMWLETSAVSYADTVPYLAYRYLLLGLLGLPVDAGREAVQDATTALTPRLPESVIASLRELEPVAAGLVVGTPAGSEEVMRKVFDNVCHVVAARTRGHRAAHDRRGGHALGRPHVRRPDGGGGASRGTMSSAPALDGTP